MALNRSDIRKPSLPRETVDVPELGGEVVVQALMLDDRAELFWGSEEIRKARIPAELLARSVVDNESQPVLTVDEWRIFGANQQNDESLFKLLGVAQRLSGMAPEKKDPAPS